MIGELNELLAVGGNTTTESIAQRLSPASAEVGAIGGHSWSHTPVFVRVFSSECKCDVDGEVFKPNSMVSALTPRCVPTVTHTNLLRERNVRAHACSQGCTRGRHVIFRRSYHAACDARFFHRGVSAGS